MLCLSPRKLTLSTYVNFKLLARTCSNIDVTLTNRIKKYFFFVIYSFCFSFNPNELMNIKSLDYNGHVTAPLLRKVLMTNVQTSPQISVQHLKQAQKLMSNKVYY